MAKKALCNLISGDKHIELGKVYTNEEVADLDQSNFADVPDAAATGQEEIVPVQEVKESVVPELDTQEKKSDSDSSTKSSQAGEKGDEPAPIAPSTPVQTDFEKGV